MTPHGDIYSCLVANRAKRNYLGNIVKNNFLPRTNFSKCQFKQCIMPANYEQYFWSINKDKISKKQRNLK